MKKFFFAMLGAGVLGFLGGIYFLSSGAARDTVRDTAALAAQSLRETFSSPPDSAAIEIPLDGNASSDASVTTEGNVNVAMSLDTGADATTTATTTPPPATGEAASSSADIFAVDDLASTTAPACAISTGTAMSGVPSRRIILNEVAWMGSVPASGESMQKAGNREWMELKNISGAAVDLSGWHLVNADGDIDIAFDAGNVPSGGFFLLGHDDAAADLSYKGTLSNDGEELFLFDSRCILSDMLDASSGWPGGDNRTKQTLERDISGFGWHTGVLPGGTPRAENSVPLPPVVTGDSGGDDHRTDHATGTDSGMPTGTATGADISFTTATVSLCTTSTIVIPRLPLIAAIQIASASSSDNDFVKIYNPSASPVDMSGWKLRKKAKTGAEHSLRTFPDNSVLPAGWYFVWANGEDGYGSMIGANVTSTETLSADNSVALLDASGTIVDAVGWGEGTGQYAEGSAYPTNPTPGTSLVRKTAGGFFIDTGNNAEDFVLQGGTL